MTRSVRLVLAAAALLAACGSRAPTATAPTTSVAAPTTAAAASVVTTVATTSTPVPASTTTAAPTTTTTLAPTTTTEPPLTASEDLIFSPYDARDGNLKADIRVNRQLTGTCFSGSVAAVARPDAWRCTAGSEILDPCFEDPVPHAPLAVVCASFEDLTVVDQLLLTDGLPRDMANQLMEGTSLPWVMELEGGIRCGIPTGATLGDVAGQSVTWYCDGGLLVFGGINMDRPVWTVTVDDGKSSTTRTVNVVRRWQ